MRDKIPDIIIKSGKKCRVVTLSNNDFLAEMERKLSEELNEYVESKSVDELVDIIEVALRIAELRGVPELELEKIRRSKARERGAFSKNYFLIDISESI